MESRASRGRVGSGRFRKMATHLRCYASLWLHAEAEPMISCTSLSLSLSFSKKKKKTPNIWFEFQNGRTKRRLSELFGSMAFHKAHCTRGGDDVFSGVEKRDPVAWLVDPVGPWIAAIGSGVSFLSLSEQIWACSAYLWVNGTIGLCKFFAIWSLLFGKFY